MKIELKPIQEQVVVLLGASSGIGRLAALELAKRGARVVVAARGTEGLDTVAREIAEAGGKVHAVPTDAAEPTEANHLAAEAERVFGGIDTWVNLAGVAVYAPFEETSADEFERVIRVNLLGVANGTRAALPLLRKRGRGALINISSVEAKVAIPLHSAYAASKHGVKGLTDALRIELQHENIPISVTNIMPAAIDTPFFEHSRTKLGVEPKGVPPHYDPMLVVRAIIHAAEHPERDIVVGGAGKAFILSQAIAPSLTDRFLARVGIGGQRTRRSKSVDAPDALERSAAPYRVRGGRRSLPRQILAKARPLWVALGVAALGVFAWRRVAAH